MRKTLALVFSCLVCWLFAGGLCLAKEPEHTLLFFFENVCASCHTEDTFYDLFNRCVSPEEKAELSYEIRTYNVFLDANMATYEEMLEEAGLDRTSFALPVLVADGQWISGYDEMEARLRNILFEEKAAGEAVEGGQETGSAASAADGPETEQAAGAADSPADFEIPALDIGDDVPAALLFTTYACEECDETKAYLEALKNKTPFSITELSVAEGGNVRLFKELLRIYGRQETEGVVPAVFAGTHAYLGKEEITEGLPALLSEGGASCGVLKEQLSKVTGQETVASVSFAAMFGAGLLSGFNPCSISMLLMLFSILLTTKAPVLKNGLLYLAGKYAAYLSIGLAICLAASQIGQTALDRFGSIVNWVIVLLFLAAAALNFMDFLHVRKQEYGKVRMQLPQRLRRFNHRLLKKTGRLEGTLLSLLVLGLGVAVSFGEFFCTGQIYMASILYLLRTAREEIWLLLGTLIVYVTAMCIPAAVILFIIAKTKGTEKASDFMLRHMDAIKLLNAILFVLYAVYFILK